MTAYAQVDHPYIAGQPFVDRRDRQLASCATCKQIMIGGGAKTHPDYVSPKLQRSKQSAAPPKLEVLPPPETKPKPEPKPRQIRIAPPPAEMAMAALSIDNLLAMPPGVIDWHLRIRLDEVRKLLRVPTFPTLNPDAVELEDIPPDELEKHPVLVRPPAPVAIGGAIANSITDKRRRELVKRASRDGWEVSRTANNHVALDHNDKRVIVSTSEGYGRSWNNLRAQAKRAGIDVTGL